jgi:putative ABC transport system permease protein
MLRNMLLVTYRNLIKNKSFTLINIVGLALGIAAFVLISAYVHFEKSYDRINADAGNIYRVESDFYKGNQLINSWATSTNGYAPAMKANFPEIASFTRINFNSSERVVRYGETKFREAHVCFADSNFFQFFNYRLIRGDAARVLKDVNTIAISESAAQKYFGKTDPMGKFLAVANSDGTLQCMVTGIFKDVPVNTTMQFSFLISWASTPLWERNFWYLHESYTFIKLKPGGRIAAVEAKFPALAERYKTRPNMKDQKWAISLAPLTTIHLNPAKAYEFEAKGNANAVDFLNIMAFVILIIACVNYINLATTKAADRAREIGIRKVSGAHAGQVLAQFLIESGIINLFALAIGLILIRASIYLLPLLTGKSATESLLFDLPLYLQVAGCLLTGMFLSGFYPAMVLANVNPVIVLKGRYTFSKGGVLLRKGMVAFQFTASLLLIAGTIAIYRQISFMGSVDTGVNISETLVMKAPPTTDGYTAKVRSFKEAVRLLPGVKIVTGSGAVPGKEIGEFLADRRYGASKSEERLFESMRVDFDFVKAYDLKIIAGRTFDVANPSDSTGVILNEAAVKVFGFTSPGDAVGKKVWVESLDKRPNLVIGVVKNYHQQSLQVNFTPIMLLMDPALPWLPTNYYSVKTTTAHTRQVVAGVQSLWAQYFPESSFDFFFLDDFYNNQYRQDTQFGDTFMLFSSLAIVIACMGLFGLTAYATARRRREIGVRKVLGASVQHIMGLLTWDLVKLILFCSLVAIPAAYLLVTQWLNHYAFKVPLNIWQFVAPVLALILITLGTISYLTFKAALTNPAVTLKDELG